MYKYVMIVVIAFSSYASFAMEGMPELRHFRKAVAEIFCCNTNKFEHESVNQTENHQPIIPGMTLEQSASIFEKCNVVETDQQVAIVARYLTITSREKKLLFRKYNTSGGYESDYLSPTTKVLGAIYADQEANLKKIKNK